MTLHVRTALPTDAVALCRVINRIIQIGGTTAYDTPFSPEGLIAEFLRPKFIIACHLAETENGAVGFQSIVRSDPDWSGPDRLGPEWALISTYVAEGTQGTGIGTRLFAQTLHAARADGVASINATIRLGNAGGRAYYSRMDFVPWREDVQTVWQRFDF